LIEEDKHYYRPIKVHQTPGRHANHYTTEEVSFQKVESNKMTKKIPYCRKSNIKIAERGKIDTSNIQIHDGSLSLLDTGTSIKSDRVKIYLWAKPMYFKCNG
jgi:hypothetical protein